MPTRPSTRASRRLSTRLAAVVLSGAAALGAASALPASGSPAGTGTASTPHRSVCGSGHLSRSVDVVGLTSDQRLICFRSDRPERARTIADGDLAYTPGTPATGVTGAAYTNNDADAATGTTLFDVDSSLDQVAIQSPPNAGSLVATGALGVDTGTDVAADIVSTIRRGTTVDNTAFAALSTAGASTFHEIDLLTGRAGSAGRFPGGTVLIGIAVLLS